MHVSWTRRKNHFSHSKWNQPFETVHENGGSQCHLHTLSFLSWSDVAQPLSVMGWLRVKMLPSIQLWGVESNSLRLQNPAQSIAAIVSSMWHCTTLFCDIFFEKFMLTTNKIQIRSVPRQAYDQHWMGALKCFTTMSLHTILALNVLKALQSQKQRIVINQQNCAAFQHWSWACFVQASLQMHNKPEIEILLGAQKTFWRHQGFLLSLHFSN